MAIRKSDTPSNVSAGGATNVKNALERSFSEQSSKTAPIAYAKKISAVSVLSAQNNPFAARGRAR